MNLRTLLVNATAFALFGLGFSCSPQGKPQAATPAFEPAGHGSGSGPGARTKTPTSLTYGFIADGGTWNGTASQVVTSLGKSNVHDLILAGDNLYDAAKSYEDVWAHWKTDGFRFPLVAIGNHNIGYAEEMKYFEMPSEYYAKSLGEARFIVLNSDNVQTAQAQSAFLKKELETAQEQYVFIIYHHSTFTITDFHQWKEKEAFQSAIRPLLKKYTKRITALLVGHDHIAALEDINGLPMVVSGAVFEERDGKNVDYTDSDGFHVKTRWAFRGSPHWARLDVSASEVWLNFVRADNETVACSARLSPRPMLLKDNCVATGL